MSAESNGTSASAGASLALDEKLDTTGYTKGQVLQMLEEHNPKFADVKGKSAIKEVSAKDISEGKGFMSHVYRVVIEFDDADKKKPYSFMMKIPTWECIEKAMEEMKVNDENWLEFRETLVDIHNHECDAYKFMKRIRDFPQVETWLLAKSSKQSAGLILMEDLSDRAKTGWFTSSVTAPQCLNMARHMGSYHAQMNFIDGWRGNYPDSFHTDPKFISQVDVMFKQVLDVRPDFKDLVDRLTSIRIADFNVYALKELPAKHNALVFSHGDCAAHNVLFRLAEDGSMMDEVAGIIDWQVVHEGNPLFDIARFMTLSADAEVRREVERQAVDAYYDSFCAEYEKRNEKAPFTREQAHELYDYSYVHQFYQELGIVAYAFRKMDPNVEQRVVDAIGEKAALRGRLGGEDAIALMEKYDIFERFKKEPEDEKSKEENKEEKKEEEKAAN